MQMCRRMAVQISFCDRVRTIVGDYIYMYMYRNIWRFWEVAAWSCVDAEDTTFTPYTAPSALYTIWPYTMHSTQYTVRTRALHSVYRTTVHCACTVHSTLRTRRLHTVYNVRACTVHCRTVHCTLYAVFCIWTLPRFTIGRTVDLS